MVSRVLGILLLCSALLGAPTALAQRVETGFLDRAITVGGIEYRYEVYVPRDYDPARRWPVILALHGGGELGSDGILPTVGALAKAIRQHPDRFPPSSSSRTHTLTARPSGRGQAARQPLSK
jgi:fermentation-respiration switch protein FrsA (DUF1100 family)